MSDPGAKRAVLRLAERATSGWRGLPQVEPRCRNATSCLEIPPIRPTEGWLHTIQKITSCRLSWTAPWLGSTAAGAAKPAARLVFGLYPTPVLGDPRLSVSFGGEWADLGRIALRDTDLHGERPVANWDHTIGRLGVGVGPLCHWLDHRLRCPNTGALVRCLCVVRTWASRLPLWRPAQPAPVRGAGSSSRKWDTPPAAHTLEPARKMCARFPWRIGDVASRRV